MHRGLPEALSTLCQPRNIYLTKSNVGSDVSCFRRVTTPIDLWIPQRVQRSTLREQHSQLGDVNSAHERDVDPEESSDAPFNPIDNTEDAKTQRGFDESETDDVLGLRGDAPLYRCISSGGTETFDVLSKTCVNPFGDEKGIWEADDLLRLISTSICMPHPRTVESLRRSRRRCSRPNRTLCRTLFYSTVAATRQ